MTLTEIARKHNILPAHLAQAMGCSRQFVEQIGKSRTPTLKTLERACAGFKRLGIVYAPADLFKEIVSDRNDR